MSDFWTRRRAAARAEEEARARSEDEARAAAVETEAETDSELCATLGLPDVEALGPGDDLSAFMARAVPQRLRRRALRALWARDPRLANLDGLLDYGQDFTDAGVRAGAVATAYEVGRGAVRRLDALADDEAVDRDGAVASDVRPPEGDGVAAEPAPEEVPESAPTLTAEAEEPEEAPAAPARRRMRFTFEDAA